MYINLSYLKHVYQILSTDAPPKTHVPKTLTLKSSTENKWCSPY